MNTTAAKELDVDVAIIGAGPAGLTAGYLLTKQGKTVAIIEKDETYVGGISRTVEHEGYRFDIGGHRFFSKSKEIDGKRYFKTHDSFRLGVGGYFGTTIKSKQITTYDDDNFKSREKIKGDFNVTQFVYGLSTYVGYKSTSLYLKYNLTPMFTDNAVKQNNVSLGVRFDFN